jgi:nucleotidyltransferase/DNA polymerase involved in DNA repair
MNSQTAKREKVAAMAERYVANDLAELKGIGPKHAEMLHSIGVASVKELRHRDPSHLLEMINKRHGEVVGIGLNQLKVWVEEAKSHSPQ